MFFRYDTDAIRRLVDDAIDTRMRQGGEAAVAMARDLVPVRTGKLRDSIGYIYRQEDRTLQVYADMPYAAVIEFGSIRQRAHPYLRPAINAVSRVWGGSTELAFFNAYQRSGKPPHPHIAAHNRKANARANVGRAKKARVRFRQAAWMSTTDASKSSSGQ